MLQNDFVFKEARGPNMTLTVPLVKNLTEPSPSKGRRLNVFLDQPRVEEAESLFPGRTVAVLSTGCTATAIGANVVLTNAHCLGPDMVLYFGFSEGTFVASDTVVMVKFNPVQDWALLQTSTMVGLNIGFMNVEFREASHFSEPRDLEMIAYSGDHCSSYGTCRSLRSSCTSEEVTDVGIFHSCSATRGSSGSALFTPGTTLIQAYNFAEYRYGSASLTLPTYSREFANVARPTSLFLTALSEFQDECAPGCPAIWVGDGVCQEACIPCENDGDDCECAPGCSMIHYGDGVCQDACRVQACGYDHADCQSLVGVILIPVLAVCIILFLLILVYVGGHET
jgi:hypothetical protein